MNEQTPSFKQISAKETYPLRSTVLRSWEANTPCPFPDDETAVHYAMVLTEEPVCIASFYEKSTERSWSASAIQLRGMATDSAKQGQGLGKMLVENAVHIYRQKGFEIMWCNARIVASGFYEKLGFKTIGPPFEIAGIGTHYVMVLRMYG